MRGIGVAVMCSRCGTRPRRRLGVQRGALADAEAVLLVDDGDGEVLRRPTGSSISACVPTISCSSPVARRARISRRRAAVVEPVSSAAVQQRARHQRLDRREVLVGQRLGRRHQRGLAAVLDGAQHRVQRDDGLAGADLAHQQPLHRARRARGRRRRRPSRCPGRRSGVNGSGSARQARGDRGRLGQRRGVDVGAALVAQAQLDDLVEQQLVEGQAAAAALVVAEVRGGKRGRSVGKLQRLGAARPAAGR